MNQPLIHFANDHAIAQAARLLAGGDLVAFPTETVYGLGADATSDRAVAGIYAAKGRPSFNPLIVHVADLAQAETLADLDDRARALAQRFWPGPLTLVVRRRRGSAASLLVSAGMDSLAIRCPDHPVALALIRASGIPLAAPSANVSGSISPTTAHHVAQSLGSRVAMILDGGPCRVGIESSVLDLCHPVATVLRPGGITREALALALCQPVALPDSDDSAPRSPGQLASHYAPSLPVRLNAHAVRPGEALLAFGPGHPAATLNLSPSGDLEEAAANLFAMLRGLDEPCHSGIAVTPIPMRGLGIAINDRLTRAAAPRPAVSSISAPLLDPAP